MHDVFPARVYLRKNDHAWPPVHTPLVWQKNLPNRVGVMMQTLPGGFTKPNPPVLSLVTGKLSYNDFNSRELLIQWIDHPQRLWDAVYETLSGRIETVIHVGPDPNLIPATFNRLRDNVQAQLTGNSLNKLGLRAMARAVRRPWLTALLPSRTALLRAPTVRHIILEDWLLDQPLKEPARAAGRSGRGGRQLVAGGFRVAAHQQFASGQRRRVPGRARDGGKPRQFAKCLGTGLDQRDVAALGLHEQHVVDQQHLAVAIFAALPGFCAPCRFRRIRGCPHPAHRRSHRGRRRW